MKAIRTKNFYLSAILIVLGGLTARGQTIFVPGGTNTNGVGASGNGNVGIGTAFPDRKFTIQAGHGDTGLRLFSDNYGQGLDGANTALLSLWASEPGWTWNGAGIGNNVVNSNGIVRVTATRGASYVRLLDNQIALNTVDSQGADRSGLFVSNGNVGIGTTSPGSRKLNIQSPDSTNDVGVEIALGRTIGTNYGLIVNTSGVGASLNQGILATASGASANYGIRIYNVAESAGNFSLYSDSSAKSYFGGNVGIGTTSPEVALHVYGSGKRSGLSDIALPTSGDEFGMFTVKVSTSATAWAASLVSYGTDGKGLRVYNNGGAGNTAFEVVQGAGSRFIVNGSGNVGIGTTNPTQKLSVNGTIRAKEVIVEASPWPDYVFAEDYKLAPLSDVEAEIKTEKHLPGMPSAQEVAEKGVTLGEMQAKLLAKMEEMTLRMIAQQKQIENQSEQIAELRVQLGSTQAAK